MSRTLQSPVSLPRLATGANSALRAVLRGWDALVAEHALALRAAASATLPRRRLDDLRTIYTAPKAGRGNAAAKGSFRVKALKSRAPAGRLVAG